MSLRFVRMAGVALLFGAACIRRPEQPAAAKPVAQDDEGRARAALAKARQSLDAGHAREARQLVDAVLLLSVSAKTRAELLTLVADASWEDPDASGIEAHEAALAAWEGVPGSDERVAEALVSLAMVLEMATEFAEAERHLFRAITIRERLHGVDAKTLEIPFAVLINIYDQECRVAELERTLGKLERVYAANPGLPDAGFFRARSRALIDRRTSKLDAAIDGIQRALAAGQHQKDSGLFSDTAVLLADYARDLGRYSDQLRFLEQAPAQQKERLSAYEALHLHFAYDAVADPRRAAHDEKYRIRAAHAGDELFPVELPPIEACAPATGEHHHGLLYRVILDEERLEPCFGSTPAKASSSEVWIMTLMRVGQGRVVAAQSAGIGFDETTVQCVARAALGIEVPGPHDFNFVSDDYTGQP